MFSGNNTYLRAYVFDSGTPVDLSGWAMTFRYSYGQYSTQGMVTVTGMTSFNRVDFLGATNIYARPYENYYWSISGVHNDGYTKTFGTGTLKVYYDPATSTNLFAMMEQVNISWLTNYVGIQIESNRLNIAILQTSKVDVTSAMTNFAILGSNNTYAAGTTQSVSTLIANAVVLSGNTEQIVNDGSTIVVASNVKICNTNESGITLGDPQIETNGILDGMIMYVRGSTNSSGGINFVQGNGVMLDCEQGFLLKPEDILKFVFFDGKWVETKRIDK